MKNSGTNEDARQEFMSIVYNELHSDGDNNRANRIIDAADEYAESVQLGTNLAQFGTDCISRQAVINIALQYCPDDDGVCSKAGHDPREMLDEIEALPPAQLEPCNYVNACNELAKNNISSIYSYLQILKEFEKYGYILVDTMGNIR